MSEVLTVLKKELRIIQKKYYALLPKYPLPTNGRISPSVQSNQEIEPPTHQFKLYWSWKKPQLEDSMIWTPTESEPKFQDVLQKLWLQEDPEIRVYFSDASELIQMAHQFMHPNHILVEKWWKPWADAIIAQDRLMLREALSKQKTSLSDVDRHYPLPVALRPTLYDINGSSSCESYTAQLALGFSQSSLDCIASERLAEISGRIYNEPTSTELIDTLDEFERMNLSPTSIPGIFIDHHLQNPF